MLRVLLQRFLEHQPDHGAYRPAPAASQSTDHHHHQQRGRLRPVHRRRAHEAIAAREQRARQPRDGAGDRKGHELQLEHRIAQRPHARLVVADAHQRMAEARLRRAVQPPERERHDGQHHPVEVRFVAQVEAWQQRGSAHQRVAVVAAIAAQRHHHEVQHLRKGQRGHDEVDAARAQRHRADQRRDEAGHERGQRPHHPCGHHARIAERHHRVGAHADEARMPERHHAAEAQDEVEAGGSQRHHEHAPHEADVELEPEQRRDQRKGREQQEEQAEADVA